MRLLEHFTKPSVAGESRQMDDFIPCGRVELVQTLAVTYISQSADFSKALPAHCLRSVRDCHQDQYLAVLDAPLDGSSSSFM